MAEAAVDVKLLENKIVRREIKMKKKIQCLLMLIVFLLSIFCMFNKTNANELIGLMKVYKIKIKLSPKSRCP